VCAYKVSKARGQFLVALTRNLQHPKLVTLTIPTWTGDPRQGISYLRAHFNLLRKHELFAQVKAGAYSIELKRKDGGWHIHIHVLMDAPYLPYQKLFAAWQYLTGQEAPHVDIRSADNERAKRYITKYAAKASDFHDDPETAVAWYLATKGMRLFATFGEWYALTPEDVLDPEDKPDFEPKCPHCGAVGSLFYARDGPFIMGGEIWDKVARVYVPDLIFERVKVWKSKQEVS
jgi:hypothetical protein